MSEERLYCFLHALMIDRNDAVLFLRRPLNLIKLLGRPSLHELEQEGMPAIGERMLMKVTSRGTETETERERERESEPSDEI